MTMRSALYDRHGQPIGKHRFMFLYEDLGYRQIGLTQITLGDDPGFLISTTWLGVDMGTGYGAPVIFETQVTRYGGKSPHQERYCTDEDALKGHAFFVRDLISKLFRDGHRSALVIDTPTRISLIKENK
jgi:hypothetical protein